LQRNILKRSSKLSSLLYCGDWRPK